MSELEKGLRAVCNNDEFVKTSEIIFQNVIDDLQKGTAPLSKVNREFDAVIRAINTLSHSASRRLSINLQSVCGDRHKGKATLDNFLLALNHDNPKLETGTRDCLIGAVYSTFIEYELPIDRRRDGPLTRYYELAVAATGAAWSVDYLTRDTFKMLKQGWQVTEKP